MSKPLPKWVWHLHASLYRHAIAISFGPRPQAGSFEIHSGTAFLLDLGAHPILITAGHVVDDVLSALTHDPPTVIMLGNHEVNLRPEDVVRARSKDLAAVHLTDRLVSKLEQDFRIVRPASWPPPELRLRDPVVFAGFPGSWRLVSAGADVDFRALTSLALISSVNDAEFLCHLDPAYREEREEPTTALEDLPEDAVGGLSGAPGFLVRNEDPRTLLVPQLCGIVKEGGGGEVLGPGHRLIYFTRLDDLRPDGRM